MMSLPVWLPGPMFLLGWGVSVPGPTFLPGGLCPGGSLSRRVSVQRGVSVQGGLCQGDPPPRQRPHLYSKEWVVRILLEFFLVLKFLE